MEEVFIVPCVSGRIKKGSAMPCYHPIQATYSPLLNKVFFGINYEKKILEICKRDSLSFVSFVDAIESVQFMQLPCGRCIGCRLEHSRKWALRCVHEASLYDKNCFITLTYDDEHLPKDSSLVKRDLQLFFKRLRKRYPGHLIRYFAAGEYGDNTARPHYHAILFNFCPEDFKPGKDMLKLDPLKFDNDWSQLCSKLSVDCSRLFSSVSSVGSSARHSRLLSDCWGNGSVMVGEVSFESCAYVARYCLKKITGEAAEEHYHGRQPEFVVMSRRPGIGAEWLKKNFVSILETDTVATRSGILCKPPRYYDNMLEVIDADKFLINKEKRLEFVKDKVPESDERLAVMEECLRLRTKNKRI